MAVCFIENIINDHPTLDLRIAFYAAGGGPGPLVTFVGEPDLGVRAPRGLPFNLGPIQTIPPGETLSCGQNLRIPWGDHFYVSAIVESKRSGQSVAHRFNVSPKDSWDHVFHRVNGQVTDIVEAGTVGEVPGINHSAWDLCLDNTGRVLLKCKRRDGLSIKDTVTLVVGLAAAPIALLGAGLAFGATAAGLVLAGATTIFGLAAGGVGAGAVVAAAATAAAAGVAGPAVATAAAAAGAMTPGVLTVALVSAAVAGAATITVSTCAAGALAATIPAVGAGVFLGCWTAFAPNTFASAVLAELGQLDLAAGKPGDWSLVHDAKTMCWKVDLGQAHPLSLLQLTTDARRDFEVWGSNTADMTGRVILSAASGAPGTDLNTLTVEILDPTPFRYVAVATAVREPFRITQLRAFSRPKDLAAGQPVSASSQWSPEHSPDKANDGGPCATGGWSPAGYDTRSYWQVDLGRPYALSSLHLITRQDGDQPEQRRNFRILASNQPDMRESVVLAAQGSTSRPFKDVFRAVVEDPTPYRYLRVVKSAPGDFFIAKFCVYEASAVVEEIRPSYGLSALPSAGSRSSELFFARARQPLALAVGGQVDWTSFAAAGHASGAVSTLRAGNGQEVFLRGGDGYLHRFSRPEGGAWTHESEVFRAAGKVDGDISAAFAAQRSHSEVFFRGEDGLLHFFYFRDGRWMHDESYFRGSGSCWGALSAFFNAGRNHVEVFAAGADGNLRYFWLNGASWALDASNFQPGKVTGAISALYSPRLGHCEVYYRGEGKWLRHSYVADGRTWSHATIQELGEIDGDIRAVYQPTRKQTEVFFRGADGYLHYLYLGADGRTVAHHDATTFRVAGKVLGPITALYNPARDHTEAFFAGEDGLLHAFFVEGGAWQHQAQRPVSTEQDALQAAQAEQARLEAQRAAQEAERARLAAQQAERARLEAELAAQTGVVIFSDGYFQGASQRLGPGQYDLGQLTIGGDQLSSLRVPPGWRVTLYEHPGFSGESAVYTADAIFVDAFNDRTSSIVVEDASARPKVRRWVFVQGMDSPGADLGYFPGDRNEEQMIAVADAMSDCVCFNTLGWYKHSLAPREAWNQWTDDPTQGVYYLELVDV